MRLRAHADGTWEFGEIRGVEIELHVAHLGNPSRIDKRLGIRAKESLHLLGALDIKLIGGERGRSARIKRGVGLNAHQRRLHLRITAAAIMAIVGGNERQVALLGKAHQHREHCFLLGNAVILNFNIEAALAKHLSVAQSGCTGAVKIALGEKLRNSSAKASGKRNQALRMRAKQLLIHARLVVKALGEGTGNDIDQIAISRHILA